jgi:hypothetical protein
VNQPEQGQCQQSSRIETHEPRASCFRAGHLDGESYPEQKRKNRNEFSLDKYIDERLRQNVSAAVIQHPDVHVSIHRRKEPALVGRQNPEQRHASQHINKKNAIRQTDRT